MVFKFTRCLKDEELEGECKGILVPICRHEDEFKTFKFEKALSIREAIEKAEFYLSQPLTKEYYQRIQALEEWWYELPFEEYQKVTKAQVRGDLLGDMHFLEEVKVEDNGILFLVLGS